MTVAVTDYASLSTAINDFAERDYAAGDLDRIIGLAESFIRLYLPPNFAKEASSTVAFTSGSASLPSGFIRVVSLLHATYGELKGSTLGAVRQRRIWDGSGIPDMYAIFGTTIEVAPTYTGNLTLDYEGTLAGLSSGATTNWLITNSPHTYLMACLTVEKFYEEDFGNYSAIQSAVFQTLTDLGMQSMVGQYSNATVVLPGVTP